MTWRLGYETELAVASYNESAYNPTSKSTPSSASNPSTLGNGTLSRQSSLGGGRAEATQHGSGGSELSLTSSAQYETQGSGDRIEIWDVRRPWIAKWTVDGSGAEGGVSGEEMRSFFNFQLSFARSIIGLCHSYNMARRLQT